MDPVQVRYEEFGQVASVWVLTWNRFRYEPGDWYNHEWICVLSTSATLPGQRLPVDDAAFLARSRPGPEIPVPWAGTWVPVAVEVTDGARRP